MGPYGPIWVARGVKSSVKKVKIIISDSDFFPGLCQEDLPNAVGRHEKVRLGVVLEGPLQYLWFRDHAVTLEAEVPQRARHAEPWEVLILAINPGLDEAIVVFDSDDLAA